MNLKSINPSAMGSWMTCGIDFEEYYIKGDRRPGGVSLARGIAFHEVCRMNHRQKMMDGADLPLDSLKDIGRDMFIRSVVERGIYLARDQVGEKDKILNTALNEMLQAIELYSEKVAPNLDPAYIEYPFTADSGIPGLPIKAVVDLVTTDGQVIDFKVMKSKGQSWADTELQPTFLMWLAKKKTGAEDLRFRYWVFAVKKVMEAVPLDTERTVQDERRLRAYIEAFLSDLKTGVFRPAPAGSWKCTEKWCSRWISCKYGGGA